MDLKKFGFDIKIFLWYLITEPFRQIKLTLKIVKHKAKFFGKQSTWLVIYTGFVIFAFLTQTTNLKYPLLLLLLIAILRFEWTRGKFRERHRKRILEKGVKEAQNEK